MPHRLVCSAHELAHPERGSVSRVIRSPRCQSIRKTRLIAGETGALRGGSHGVCELAAVLEGFWLPGEERWDVGGRGAGGGGVGGLLLLHSRERSRLRWEGGCGVREAAEL